MKQTGFSHAAVETSLDCSLLHADKIPPFSFAPKQYIQPPNSAAALIALFFPQVTETVVEKSLRSLLFCSSILYMKNPLLRKVLTSLLSRSKNTAFIADMFMIATPHAACKSTDRQLEILSEKAISLAHELIAETAIYIESEKPIGKCFRRTFNGPIED